MIPYQQYYNRSVEERYHRLAGPFDEHSAWIFEAMRSYLGKTGARIVTVGEREGVCIWRLKSECETMEETERRLKSQSSKFKSQGRG